MEEKLNIERILVLTDGAQISLKAIKTAVNIAKQNHAKLFVLHVVNTSMMELMENYYPKTKEELKEDLKENGYLYLANVEREAKKEHISIEKILRFGVPLTEIMHCAKERNIDLIVLGKEKTLKGTRRRLHDSVALKIVEMLPCSICVVTVKKKI